MGAARSSTGGRDRPVANVGCERRGEAARRGRVGGGVGAFQPTVSWHVQGFVAWRFTAPHPVSTALGGHCTASQAVRGGKRLTQTRESDQYTLHPDFDSDGSGGARSEAALPLHLRPNSRARCTRRGGGRR